MTETLKTSYCHYLDFKFPSPLWVFYFEDYSQGPCDTDIDKQLASSKSELYTANFKDLLLMKLLLLYPCPKFCASPTFN